MKNLLTIGIIIVLSLAGLGAFPTQSASTTMTQSATVTASPPTITITDQGSTVTIPEATSYTTSPGLPVLPHITAVFTYPLGTIITSVHFTTTPAAEHSLPVPVMLAPPLMIQDEPGTLLDQTAASSPTQCSYRLGAGLQGRDHVLFVVVNFYPIQTEPGSRMIQVTSSVQVEISYTLPASSPKTISNYDCLVIAPANFTTALQPLIDHKHAMGVEMLLMTLENITASYPGHDAIEQIKYAIKDAVETQGIQSVLLVGGVDQIPIRSCIALGWITHVEDNVISDLYYADLYNATGAFSSWDANNNSVFGEDDDQMDLYPDVQIGRLACASIDEVNTIVDKIIHYETETYGADWFHTMIFMGGNTFKWTLGNDGEKLNLIIHNIMTNFTPVYIWTSKHNFNPWTINNAINQGAGFVDYSGHGFEHGIGTYKTIAGRHMKSYFTPYIKGLKNGYKLPIIYLDACLTAKIDFILQDMLDYKAFRIPNAIAKALHYNTSIREPCFAWAFLKHPGGGAIATIGATRTAYGNNEIGAGKISIEFFQSYNTSTYLGEMITDMQNGYITDVPDDPFTVQEFILLGDPTLRIGGYPQ